MPLLLVIVAGILLVVFVRPGTARLFEIFSYRNELRPPGDDGLGRPKGIQEEDSVTPWRSPAERRHRT